MKCPSCKLENPPNAMQCDCGYVFGIPPLQAAENRAAIQQQRPIQRLLPISDPSMMPSGPSSVFWSSGQR
jgi:hypothetical protein